MTVAGENMALCEEVCFYKASVTTFKAAARGSLQIFSEGTIASRSS